MKSRTIVATPAKEVTYSCTSIQFLLDKRNKLMEYAKKSYGVTGTIFRSIEKNSFMQTLKKQVHSFKGSPAHLAVTSANCGFTLVEVLIVVVIIMMLSTIGFTGMTKFREAAKLSRCMNEIRSLEREITAWAIDKASMPASLNDIGRASLRDPWGNNYVYNIPTTRTFAGPPINTDFDLYSKGPNGIYVDSIDGVGSEDDVIRGRTGNYVGLAIKYY